MPRATTCTLNGTEVGVGDALVLREDARHAGQAAPDFRCAECGEAVRAFRGGGHAAAHFEHYERNSACRLSDPART